jgi:transcriptional regulator with XRE-family HTH domain
VSKLSELLNKANRQEWSTRDIEREAQHRGHQITHSTIAKYMNGKHGTPTHSVLQALADVFGLDVNTLRGAASLPATGEAFLLPDEAARLTPDQRNAVLHVVRVMLDGNPHYPEEPGVDYDEDITQLPRLPRK